MNQRLQTVIVVGVALVGLYYFANNSKSDRSLSAIRTESDPARSTFHGYECTGDCSGHEAGYNWAEEHDITDEEDCGGDSESFIEGCKAYVEEQQGISHESDDEDDPDSDE